MMCIFIIMDIDESFKSLMQFICELFHQRENLENIHSNNENEYIIHSYSIKKINSRSLVIDI